MFVLRNARVMTCDPAQPGLGFVDRGAVVVDGDRVVHVCDDAALPAAYAKAPMHDCSGALVTPGLVDCHTHAIFAGDRANEFALRASGASYLEIAEAGGGIAATLTPTRAASDGELTALLDQRLALARTTGTTTMEAKSGYDLTSAGELRLLRLLAARRPAIVPTLLAHLVPPERAADRDAFVDEIVTAWVPRAASLGLATSVDVYCDTGAFTLAETRAIFTAARAARLGVRAHAGQFADVGAAELVAEFGGLSADHLEQISPHGVHALARAGTVAVMLPGACVQLRLPPPPVARLRDAGVAMAIASDLNPGSSYSCSLPLQMWIATTHLQMSVEEAWLGVTRHAARALALPDRGALVAGNHGGAVLWKTDLPADICYRYGAPLVDRVFA
jgi:imidazolonepropionase|nr:imidazolonepropionase [Kofleriaceae bacterium]